MAVKFYQSVNDFVSTMIKFISSGGNLVSQNEANRRATICISCHNNVASSEMQQLESGCKTCKKATYLAKVASIKVIKQTVIQNRETSFDERLKSCALCGCDLSVKVWFPPESLIIKDDANAYPSFCWIKEIQNQS